MFPVREKERSDNVRLLLPKNPPLGCTDDNPRVTVEQGTGVNVFDLNEIRNLKRIQKFGKGCRSMSRLRGERIGWTVTAGSAKSQLNEASK